MTVWIRAALLAGLCFAASPSIARADCAELAVSVDATGVVDPMEAALARLPGKVRLRSRVVSGHTEVRVGFTSSDVAARAGRDPARHLLAEMAPSLPAESAPPLVSVRVPARTWRYFLTADHFAAGELGELARRLLEPVLASPGVLAASVCGSGEREMRVTVDPARLAAHGLGARELLAAIQAAPRAEPAALADLVVGQRSGAALRLADVATVESTWSTPTCRASLGEPGVLVVVEATATAAVGTLLGGAAQSLPAGVGWRRIDATAELVFEVPPALPADEALQAAGRVAHELESQLPEVSLLVSFDREPRWPACEWPLASGPSVSLLFVPDAGAGAHLPEVPELLARAARLVPAGWRPRVANLSLRDGITVPSFAVAAPQGAPELSLEVDHGRAQQLGVDGEELRLTLRLATTGVRSGATRVRFAGAAEQDAEPLAALLARVEISARDGRVPLASLVGLSQRPGEPNRLRTAHQEVNLVSLVRAPGQSTLVFYLDLLVRLFTRAPG